MSEPTRREFLAGLGLIVLAGATGAAAKECDVPGGEVELLPVELEPADYWTSSVLVTTHDGMIHAQSGPVTKRFVKPIFDLSPDGAGKVTFVETNAPLFGPWTEVKP